MRKAPLYKRVIIDGVEVRATKGEPPAGSRSYPARSAYPIYVDGVLRGALVNQQPGYRARLHKGWAIVSLMPDQYSSGSLTRVATCYSTGLAGVEELLGKVPSLIALDQMPTVDQAALRVAQRAEQARLQAIEQSASEAVAQEQRRLDAEAARQAHAEMMEGLLSIRDRLAGTLSNSETEALHRAIERLQR